MTIDKNRKSKTDNSSSMSLHFSLSSLSKYPLVMRVYKSSNCC